MNSNKNENLEVLDSIQIADILGFSPEHVRKLSEAGEIPAKKIGGRWRYLKSEILDYMKNHAES